MFSHWRQLQQRRIALKASFVSVRHQQPVRLMARVWRAWREVYWRTILHRYHGNDLHVAGVEVTRQRNRAISKIISIYQLIHKRSAWHSWMHHTLHHDIDMTDAAWNARTGNGHGHDGMSCGDQLISKATRHMMAYGRRLPGQSLLSWSFGKWLTRYRIQHQRIIAARRLMNRWRRQHLRSSLQTWLLFTLRKHQIEIAEVICDQTFLSRPSCSCVP
jgi:hypothetical protein